MYLIKKTKVINVWQYFRCIFNEPPAFLTNNKDDYVINSDIINICSFVGTSVSVGVFSHLLKIDDGIIGIYSSMSKILSSFVYGFAMTSLVFYLGK